MTAEGSFQIADDTCSNAKYFCRLEMGVCGKVNDFGMKGKRIPRECGTIPCDSSLLLVAGDEFEGLKRFDKYYFAWNSGL